MGHQGGERRRQGGGGGRGVPSGSSRSRLSRNASAVPPRSPRPPTARHAPTERAFMVADMRGGLGRRKGRKEKNADASETESKRRSVWEARVFEAGKHTLQPTDCPSPGSVVALKPRHEPAGAWARGQPALPALRPRWRSAPARARGRSSRHPPTLHTVAHALRSGHTDRAPSHPRRRGPRGRPAGALVCGEGGAHGRDLVCGSCRCSWWRRRQ